jgi:hypothetical protein
VTGVACGSSTNGRSRNKSEKKTGPVYQRSYGPLNWMPPLPQRVSPEQHDTAQDHTGIQIHLCYDATAAILPLSQHLIAYRRSRTSTISILLVTFDLLIPETLALVVRIAAKNCRKLSLQELQKRGWGSEPLTRCCETASPVE